MTLYNTTRADDELERLFTAYGRCGPDYHRGVRDAIADARQFLAWGQLQAATHYLLVAQLRAGEISWEDFSAADPFGRRMAPVP